jgi:hypothetical protein
VTGEEFAQALRETASKLELVSRVNGIVVEPLPGLRITVCSPGTERTRRYRSKSVPQGVPPPFPERSKNVSPPVLSGPDLGSGSGSDPEFSLPVGLPEKLAGSARVAAKKRTPKPRAAKWNRFPQDWQPGEKHYALARSENVSLERELARIRNWEFKTARSDPSLTFLNWLMDAGDKQRRNGTAPGTKQSVITDWLAGTGESK